MKYIDGLDYLDKLKHYVHTFGQNVENTSIIPKVERDEDVEENNIDLSDNCEYSLSGNVKLERKDDGRVEAVKSRVTNISGRNHVLFITY